MNYETLVFDVIEFHYFTLEKNEFDVIMKINISDDIFVCHYVISIESVQLHGVLWSGGQTGPLLRWGEEECLHGPRGCSIPHHPHDFTHQHHEITSHNVSSVIVPTIEMGGRGRVCIRVFFSLLK